MHHLSRSISAGVAAVALCATGVLAAVPSYAEDTSTPPSQTEDVSLSNQAEISAALKSATTRRGQLEILLSSDRLTDEERENLRPLLDLETTAADAPLAGPARELLLAAINPADYQCGDTALIDWASEIIAELTFSESIYLAFTPMLDVPTYYALLYAEESTDNEFGAQGEYTRAMAKSSKGLRAFWDIDGDSIEIAPMHGDIFDDTQGVVEALVLLEYSRADALKMTQLLQRVLPDLENLDNGRHPFFTLNAFAFDPAYAPEIAAYNLPKKIIMGDGILQANHEIGLSDKVAPSAILAHEYGHQVQLANDLFATDITDPAEATRRTELMADAYATYYLVHSRGDALNATRTLETQSTFYQTGDCGFDSPGHHGTPNQRSAASEWAAELVDEQENQGHKLSGLPFAELFDAALPELVLPDAR